jgi:hypothetical protein
LYSYIDQPVSCEGGGVSDDGRLCGRVDGLVVWTSDKKGINYGKC